MSIFFSTDTCSVVNIKKIHYDRFLIGYELIKLTIAIEYMS